MYVFEKLTKIKNDIAGLLFRKISFFFETINYQRINNISYVLR